MERVRERERGGGAVRAKGDGVGILDLGTLEWLYFFFGRAS